MDHLRQAIRSKIHELVGARGGSAPATSTSPQRGLLEPQAVARRVHADFPTMMLGGAASLLLQMLHPGALAGVWDHSDFRSDMSGRLRNTARFIAATTYRPKAEAVAAIDRVRRIHDRVRGVMPDGTRYSANDPDLLAWVHVAEVRSVLAAHRRYREPLMSERDQDRYCAEMRVIGQLLGASDLPATIGGIERRLGDFRSSLRYDERTRAVAGALLRPASLAAPLPVHHLLMQAGVDLLPGWAAGMHGLSVSPARKPLLRAAALGTSTVLRWALRT